jgi:hypothetical protein
VVYVGCYSNRFGDVMKRYLDKVEYPDMVSLEIKVDWKLVWSAFKCFVTKRKLTIQNIKPRLNKYVNEI